MSSPRSWSFVLTLRLRSSSSWASWRLSRTRALRERAARRTALLQRELDSSLLREKELGQTQLVLEHRLAEMEQSRLHRELGILPQPTPLVLPPPGMQTHLARLLAESERSTP